MLEEARLLDKHQKKVLHKAINYYNFSEVKYCALPQLRFQFNVQVKIYVQVHVYGQVQVQIHVQVQVVGTNNLNLGFC